MFGQGTTTKHIGDLAEKCAEKFLRQQGLHTITKNFNCKAGEVDLIMGHGDYLVFTEVRYRKQNFFGSAEETVDLRKQQKLVKAAQNYLQKNRLTDLKPCRFDVVSISGDLNQPKIDWIQNAFGA